MNNETQIKDIKPGYQYKVGEKISGKYHGIEFFGEIVGTRQHSINRNLTELRISLVYSISVYGDHRKNILLYISDKAEVV